MRMNRIGALARVFDPKKENSSILRKKGKKKIAKKRNHFSSFFYPATRNHSLRVVLLFLLLLLSLLSYHHTTNTAITRTKTLSPRFVANVATHSQWCLRDIIFECQQFFAFWGNRREREMMKNVTTRDISPAKTNDQIERDIEKEMTTMNIVEDVMLSSPRFFSEEEEENENDDAQFLMLNVGPVGTRRDSLKTTKRRRRSLDFTAALGENEQQQQQKHDAVAPLPIQHYSKSFLASLPPIDSPTLLKKEQKKKELAAVAETTTAETIPLQSLHLPDSFVKYLHRKGIKKLYDWQSDVLNTPGVLTHGQNIVYCAPTSGGKSLVADILLARRLTQYKGCICLLVLPFVSLCVERARDLEILLSSIHRLRVLRHFGGSGGGIPKSGTGQTYLIVCTPEKANALVT